MSDETEAEERVTQAPKIRKTFAVPAGAQDKAAGKSDLSEQLDRGISSTDGENFRAGNETIKSIRIVMKGKPRTFFYIYILRIKNNNELYIGSTNNLDRRLEEHQEGKVFSTKNYSDFDLVYYEAYISENDARMREKRLKYFGKAYQEFKKRIRGGLEGAG